MTCPDENELVDLAAGRCTPERRAALDRHIDACEACASDLAALLAPVIAPGPRAAPPTWAPGSRVGRYTLDAALGRGGMGVVFAAHDELLDRAVALKILRVELRETDREALAFEARALARLVHPDIVSVFDVGTAGDDLYFAMELVEGDTLRRHLRRHSHPQSSWRDAVALVCIAGRALGAAHRQGVTHGDFKPDNVLVTSHGRVKLVDFGLATLRTGIAPPGAGDGPSGVAGTPSYLAPEQHDGARAEPWSDQYALCVTLFEAIYGAPPFLGRSMSELAAAKRRPIVFPSEPRVPVRLRRAIARGLAIDPKARWPDLELLVSEVEAALGRRRSWRWLAVGAGGALGLGAVLLDASRRPCDADAALQLVEQRWHEVDASLGPAIAARGRTQLDAAEARWRDELARTCELADPTTAPARLACLARRKAELVAWIDTIDELAQRRPFELARAIDGLGTEVACDDAVSPRQAAAQAELARARALRISGDYGAALEVLAAVTPEIDALGVPALAHASARERAAIYAEIGDPLEGEATEAWLVAAEIAVDPDSAARAACRLAVLAAEALADPDAADQWLARADSWIARASAEQPGLRAWWHIAEGAIAWRRRDVARATEACRRAFGIAERLDDPELRESAASHLAVALARQGLTEESIPLFEQQLATAEGRLGAEHPKLVRVLLNLGASYSHVGRRDDALAVYARAQALLESANAGPAHPEMARIEHNLTGLYIFASDYERAELHARRTVASTEHATESATMRLEALYNLGAVLAARDRMAQSEAVAWRGVAEVQERYGDEHPLFASFLDLAGDARGARGDYEGALGLHQRALEIMLRDPAPDPLRVADIRIALADDLIRLGRADETRDDLPRTFDALARSNQRLAAPASLRIAESLLAAGDPCGAVGYLDRPDVDGTRPVALFAQARARRACGGDEARAIELARAALAALDRADDPRLRAAIEAWLGR